MERQTLTKEQALATRTLLADKCKNMVHKAERGVCMK